MNIDLRKYIINNFKDDNVDDIEKSINMSIDSKEEDPLIGMGVLFELAWINSTKELKDEPEGGKRCTVCFSLRLKETAKRAKENDFDYFTTTLTVSPHKNSELINKLGIEIGEYVGVKFLVADFKKREGYKRSIELSKEFDLYRQNYCGCLYSKSDNEEE